jgi:hypothetical protein
MRNSILASTIGLAILLSVPSFAQSAAGQAPAAAAIPRARDGKPNLSGIWQVLSTANFDLQDHSARKDAPGGQSVVEGGEIPYQAWALAKKRENFKNRATADTEAQCHLLGVPRSTYSGHPFQIFQSSIDEPITILYEYAHANRFIYTNGTDHPKGPIEWWMGDSRGHWEGDTLVVDNVHFNDQTWFDRAGDFHSEELHVVERYTLTDPDHINYQARIEDPKVFTKPWNINLVLYRRKEKDVQLLEFECYTFDIDKYYPFPAEGEN